MTFLVFRAMRKNGQEALQLGFAPDQCMRSSSITAMQACDLPDRYRLTKTLNADFAGVLLL